ncbi:hypothetical protein ANSO36C_14450 [Nostoc cf. commune SO-36]|uniref:Uncharacterized protein n=1 Tax=Nostoc cf. commune SO-36 TaxID=449208 RepID=A0ABM7YY82_NOSCO|nr:hypothetical protein ANSO36C_14450 [Nostoc cf. commune SO-36]
MTPWCKTAASTISFMNGELLWNNTHLLNFNAMLLEDLDLCDRNTQILSEPEGSSNTGGLW